MVKFATKSRPKSKEKRSILLIWFLIRAFLSIFSDPSGKVQRQQKCNVQRSDAVGTVKGNGYPWISAVPSDVDDAEPIGDADAKGIQYPWISPSPSIQETVIMQQTLQEPILPRNACNHVILCKTRVTDTTTVSFCLVHENQNQKIGRSHLGSVLCESVDQIQWSVPLRIPTVMSSLSDPAAHSDGCPSQIGNHKTWWRRRWWWRWWWCWWWWP